MSMDENKTPGPDLKKVTVSVEAIETILELYKLKDRFLENLMTYRYASQQSKNWNPL